MNKKRWKACFSSLLPNKTGVTLYSSVHIFTLKIFGWEFCMRCLHISCVVELNSKTVSKKINLQRIYFILKIRQRKRLDIRYFFLVI